MASREGQPGGVWVPSARDRVCGFECSSVGCGPIAVERNGEGGKEPWPRGEGGSDQWEPPLGGGWCSQLFSLRTCHKVRPSAGHLCGGAGGTGVAGRLWLCTLRPGPVLQVSERLPRARLAIVCVRSVLGPGPSCCSWSASLCALLPMAPHNSCWKLLTPSPPSPSSVHVSSECG